MRAYERFLNYAKISTASEEDTGCTPTTARQLDLALLLAEELRALGIADAHVDAYGYVYASLPATPGCEDAPALGWIAHMDTSPDFSGEGVAPILHPDYDGGDVALPQGGYVLRPEEFPFLRGLRGRTLITADGSTLLGADDKAGIAEIVTLCERLLQSGAPHGALKFAFTPDEEVGTGTRYFDVAGFGARYAYTVDGGAEGEISYENFNAASALFEVTGVSVHPGTAKGTMVNALKLCCELDSLLPAGETPEHTEGREGFYHMVGLEGSAAQARLAYIVRDHDRAAFEARKQTLERVRRAVAEKYPTAHIALTVEDTYYNMQEQIAPCMHLIENAKRACEQAGVPWSVEVTRGGTDGAQLSYRGLPCPNLGTGGYNCHGPYECITAEGMDRVVEILLNITALYAGMRE